MPVPSGNLVLIPGSKRRPVFDDRAPPGSLDLAAAHAEQAAGFAMMPLDLQRHRPPVFDLVGENKESGIGPLLRCARPTLGFEAPFGPQDKIAIDLLAAKKPVGLPFELIDPY